MTKIFVFCSAGGFFFLFWKTKFDTCTGLYSVVCIPRSMVTWQKIKVYVCIVQPQVQFVLKRMRHEIQGTKQKQSSQLQFSHYQDIRHVYNLVQVRMKSFGLHSPASIFIEQRKLLGQELQQDRIIQIHLVSLAAYYLSRYAAVLALVIFPA